ncbi:response regulator transcription factor [Streptomyces sp. AC627_RSS907]|uniref:response regulator transcription factor n=1 Tax=Streptomyces sp. AC627_RSS907 TaxID=2823684 RepID=UPI0020B73395|nr:response regulator transcription factor [Streptomyces sp. AC627_RSS907]
MARVLVVEDDQFVRSALIRHLADASHTVRSVDTALEALREVAHLRFDVVILDLGLPDLDGSEVLKMLRGITDVPVIVATARDDEEEIVRLLNTGADDYLTKPFSVEHLSARMAAVPRRARTGEAEAAPSAVLRVGGLTADPLRRRAELDGTRLDLTRREFDLLAFLAGRPGSPTAAGPDRRPRAAAGDHERGAVPPVGCRAPLVLPPPPLPRDPEGDYSAACSTGGSVPVRAARPYHRALDLGMRSWEA